MSKVIIRTSDMFEHTDERTRLARYLACFKIASWLGIVSGKEKNNSTITLYLTGSKFRICLYYLLTTARSDNKTVGDVCRRMYYIAK